MYTLTSILFVATVVSVAVALVWAYEHLGRSWGQRRRNRVIAAVALGGWLAFTGALAASGLLNNFTSTLPNVVPLLLAANVAALLIALAPLGKRLALQTPLAWLVGFQVFRVAVEIVLDLLYHAGVVPVQMSFQGRNWDILSGLTALPVAWLAAQGRLSRRGLLLWNVLCLGLLINIVIVAMLSMPTPLRLFPNEPANTFIATFPFVWLPTLLVPAALFGHLLVFRLLWESRPVSTLVPLNR